MSAELIDGGATADTIKADLSSRIERLKAGGGALHLRAVQVGENPASRAYIRRQKASCEDMGIDYALDELPADTSQDQLEAHIVGLNNDAGVSGVILQMPVPEGIDARRAQWAVAPEKDVEGILPEHMGMVSYGAWDIGPCTAMGAFELIRNLPLEPKKEVVDWVEADIARRGLVRGLYGHNAVVVGHSDIVGKPLSLMLLNNYCTVTVCHIGTVDLAACTRQADILCVAVGKPGLVTGDMVKPGAVVIDIGINRVPVLDEDGNPVLTEKGTRKMRTVGDVDAESAAEVAGHITPVPGGVGPMTVAMLLRNTVIAAEKQAGLSPA
jgi:methylenetetrahydrofolate dehydrogenase (NADP+)/methenyltetrahydrofolate cyclohydrolase